MGEERNRQRWPQRGWSRGTHDDILMLLWVRTGATVPTTFPFGGRLGSGAGRSGGVFRGRGGAGRVGSRGGGGAGLLPEEESDVSNAIRFKSALSRSGIGRVLGYGLGPRPLPGDGRGRGRGGRPVPGRS